MNMNGSGVKIAARVCTCKVDSERGSSLSPFNLQLHRCYREWRSGDRARARVESHDSEHKPSPKSNQITQPPHSEIA